MGCGYQVSLEQRGLAVSGDCCRSVFRGIVDWQARERMKKALAISALNKAIAIRQPKPGLIQHADRGSQYASQEDCKRLNAHSMIPSMSKKGNCDANAMGETVFQTIKAALIWRTAFQRRDAAIKAIGAESDGLYHPVRRQSALGYQAPIACEAMRQQSNAEALL